MLGKTPLAGARRISIAELDCLLEAVSADRRKSSQLTRIEEGGVNNANNQVRILLVTDILRSTLRPIS